MKKLKLPEIKNKANIILYICIFAGIVLRFFQLGTRPITAAEFSAVNFSAGSNIFQVILNNAANNNEAPLYYIITYLWTIIFGVSEFSVRVLPVIFGIISIFIVHRLTRSFYSEKVSVIATSLFALCPFQIYFSQVSGGNTLLLMTCLLMVYYFMLSVKYNSFVIGPFTFWAVVSLYSGHMSILLLLILNVILFIRYKEEIRINLWLRSQIYILLTWLPLLVYFIKGNMVLPHHVRDNIYIAPLLSFKNMILGFTIDFNLLTVCLLIAASLFLLIGVITCRTIKEKRMTDIMSLVFFLVVGFTWTAALFNWRQYLDSSILIAGAMLIIILSIGISHLSKEGMILFSLITVIFFSVSIYNYFGVKKWQPMDYKPLYMEVMRGYNEGDIIIHNTLNSYGPFEFYNSFVYKRNYPDRLTGTVPLYKGNIKVRGAWRKVNQFLSEKMGLDVYAGYGKNILTDAEIKPFIKPGLRVWNVEQTVIPDAAMKKVDTSWLKNLSVEKEFPANGVVLSLLVKK